jgi:hypothetical protein
MHKLEAITTGFWSARAPVERGLDALVFAMSLALFVPRAQRSVGLGDSAELVIASATLGIPHPPGYPVYTWIGKTFSLLPIGGLPFRISLVSAVSASLVIALLFRCVANEMRGQDSRHSALTYIPAALAAVLLAGTVDFFESALIAEVYSLKCLITALLIHTFTKYLNDNSPKHLYSSSFLLGLSLGVYLSNVLLVPAFSILAARKIRKLKTAAVSVGMFCLGVSQYLYLYVRAWTGPVYHHPQAHFFETSSWTGTDSSIYNWAWFITGGKWRDQGIADFEMMLVHGRQLFRSIYDGYGEVGIALILTGIAACLLGFGARKKHSGLVFLTVLVCETIYFLAHRVSELRMILPFFMCLCGFMGLALGLGSIRIRGWLAAGRARATLPFALFLFASLYGIATLLPRSFPDYSERDAAAVFVLRMIETVPKGSVVDGAERWYINRTILYFEIIEGMTVRFEASECEDHLIPAGKCFALGSRMREYQRRGYRPISVLRVAGMPPLYRIALERAGD